MQSSIQSSMQNNKLTIARLVRLGIGAAEHGNLGICSDESDAAALAAETIACGARAAGSAVYDFGRQSLPILRKAARIYGTFPNIYAYSRYGEIQLKIIDGRGIRSDRFFEPQNEYTVNTPGIYVRVNDLRKQYTDDIMSAVKSESFDINLNLSTRSRLMSEIIGDVLGKMHLSPDSDAAKNYALCGRISKDGERFIPQTEGGRALSRAEMLSLIFYILLREGETDTFVLPDHAPKYISDAVKKLGGKIVLSGSDEKELADKILKFGSRDQLMMQYDGLYAAIKIFDFLNRSRLEFDKLCEFLPSVFRAEAEVYLRQNTDETIAKLSELLGRSICDDGAIRFGKNGGTVVILPCGQEGAVRIISEFGSMEAAREISANIKNKIKTLANV